MGLKGEATLQSRNRIPIIGATILLFLISSLGALVHADTINPGLFSKDSSPYDIPYRQWISKWWQWNMEIPTAQHPRENYSPEKCAINQSGPVWFLADVLTGKEERTCTIPAGKAILVPLLTGECHDDRTADSPKTDDGIRQCAMAGNEYGVITATLDGKRLKNLEQYRVQSGFHDITVPKDNIFGNLPGTFRGMADGFFVFLEPLSPGKHNLHLTTSVSNDLSPQFNYAGQVTYHLIVRP